jgi:hypothetical protein
VITPDAIFSISALMTNVKNPRVRMLMGNVRRIRIGRNSAFNIPSIAAAKKAETKPLTCIPSSR